MSSVEFKYHDGQLSSLTIHDPQTVDLADFRGGGSCEPFIALTIGDGQVEAKVYLSPLLAEDLLNRLTTLFQSKKETNV